MQAGEAFLILYLAHLAADFLLQTDAMVRAKKHAPAKAFAQHGAIHYVTILAVTAVAQPNWLAQARFQAAAVTLVVAHLAIDWCKERLVAKKFGDNVLVFLADQAVHLITVAAAALFLTHTRALLAIDWLREQLPNRERVLGVAVIYMAVVFAGGYLIRFLTKPLTQHLRMTDENGSSLRNAGMYIGWLERGLVLTALLLRSPATVGLVLAAKSIARFPELGKSERFAEYFLIGTLLSLLAAIFGGIILLKLLTGRVNLAP
jgi:hypothetical protein